MCQVSGSGNSIYQTGEMEIKLVQTTVNGYSLVNRDMFKTPASETIRTVAINFWHPISYNISVTIKTYKTSSVVRF